MYSAVSLTDFSGIHGQLLAVVLRFLFAKNNSQAVRFYSQNWDEVIFPQSIPSCEEEFTPFNTTGNIRWSRPCFIRLGVMASVFLPQSPGIWVNLGGAAPALLEEAEPCSRQASVLWGQADVALSHRWITSESVWSSALLAFRWWVAFYE